MTGTVMTAVCPVCQAPVAPDEHYCECCGAELTVPTGGVSAGIVAALEGAGPGTDPPGGAPTSPDGAPGPVPDPAPTSSAPSVGGGSPRRRQVLGTGVLLDSPDLAAPVLRCPSCSGPVADDGYCQLCGSPAPRRRDHWVERPVGWVAAMCDRGIRHARNEDALAVAAREEADSFAALVVCDGVSSSSGSDVASLAAARAARDVLAHRAAGIEGPGARPAPVSAPAPAPAVGPYPAGAAPVVDPNELTRDPEDAEAGRRAWLPVPEPTFSSGGRAEVLATWLTEATHAANLEVIASAGDPPRANPPSCTFVGAILEGTNLAVGWVGDSRAYWVPDDGEPEQLTVDDSWAAEQIALGATREEAENSPQAHAITRWLGVDAPHPAPRVTVRSADRPGWLLVCSDGLWNYASAPEDVRALLSGTVAATGPDPAAVTASLVGWAIARGGHDNISVALARVGGTGQ